MRQLIADTIRRIAGKLADWIEPQGGGGTGPRQ
jgi:hypothetical protein